MLDPGVPDRFVTVLAANTAFDLRMLEDMLGRPLAADDLEPDNRVRRRARQVGVGGRLPGVDLDAQTPVVPRDAVVVAPGRWQRTVTTCCSPRSSRRHLRRRIGYLSGPEGAARVAELLQFTAQFNVTGQPAISLPLYWTADGLPVGSQLVAAYGREDVLVRVAAQLEAAAPWPTIAPR